MYKENNVTICIYSGNNEIEVLQVKDILEQNGIITYVKNLHTQNILGSTKMFTGIDLLAGDIEIYVNKDDFDNALTIINKKLNYENNTEKNTEEYEEENIFSETKNNIDYYEESILGKSFILSLLTFLISPLFFNITYLLHLWKNKKYFAIINIIISLISLNIGIIMIIYPDQDDYDNRFFGLILIPIFCVIKSISIYTRKKSLISLIYLFIALLFVLFFRYIRSFIMNW